MSLVFDIETEGLSREEILATVPPFNRDEVKLGNRKDPASIMKYMENAEEEYYEKFVERAALDARTGTLLCIGLLRRGNNGKGDVHYLLEGPEKSILYEFWTCWQGEPGVKRFVGFNILRFDLPFMVRRSWHLGIPVPPDVWDGRYFNKAFVDLLAYWSLGNRDEMVSLDALARFFGLQGKNGSGKGFSKLWHEDKKSAIEYLKHDLELTSQIEKRMML